MGFMFGEKAPTLQRVGVQRQIKASRLFVVSIIVTTTVVWRRDGTRKKKIELGMLPTTDGNLNNRRYWKK